MKRLETRAKRAAEFLAFCGGGLEEGLSKSHGEPCGKVLSKILRLVLARAFGSRESIVYSASFQSFDKGLNFEGEFAKQFFP